MYIAYYTAMFEGLSRYYSHYIGVNYEGSKCLKFENGMCLEINQLLEIKRSLASQCWLTSLEIMMKIAEQDLLTIRV